MKITNTINDLKTIIQQWQAKGLRIGFVPTMGNLHAGHIELVNQARSHCDKVVVSIFVNPLQFNQASDLDAYPKSLETDKQKLIGAKADCLFFPSTDLMYPQGQSVMTKVCVAEISSELEGEYRSGHFDGVATVVSKLFNLVQPQVAYFGEKDYQQLLLVKKMVVDLNMPIEICSVPTYRETDGLAMSSRNSRLSAEQRVKAPTLYRVLQQVSQQLKPKPIKQRQIKQGQIKQGQKLAEVEAQAIEQLQQAGFDVEYVSVRDCSTLKSAHNNHNNRLVLAAAHLGNVRLIDNVIID